VSLALATAQSEESTGPLTPEHHQQIASAHTRGAKIRAAARVASFNGWVTGVFAVLSAPFAPFSFVSFLVTVGLFVVTYNEFRGKKLLLAFDPAAARLLGWNQLGFLGMITAYSLWMILDAYLGDGPFAKEFQQYPELKNALGSAENFQRLYRLVILAIYSAVILFSAVFQGYNAFFYFTRSRYLSDYLRETPGWIVQMQRAQTA